MSKAISGAGLLGGAILVGAVAFDIASGGTASIALLAVLNKAAVALAISGLTLEAGALAQALSSTGGIGETIRRPAGFRQIIYGERRIRPTMVFVSTTGSSHDQYNAVLVLAGHEIDSITGVHLNGAKVYFQGSGAGWSVRNGVGFGGIADGADHVGPGGETYNFGGTGHNGVYFEARYGDQLPGDVIGALTANDPNWAADGLGNSPYLGGCAYVYMKLEYNTFSDTGGQAAADVQFTVRGKNNIYDPRTGLCGYTSNSALVVADMLTDTQFGLADVGSVNIDQLIAAANICDESVACAVGTEIRYCAHWMYDTSISPGDAIANILTSMGGRVSRVSGEWFIFPASWAGVGFTLGESDLTGPVDWIPYRSLRDLSNRVNGTYIAPNVPYNDAGDLYDSNGWFEGTILNNWPFGFQPTNYPQYAQDTLHGYDEDLLLEADSGVQGLWDSGTTYALGDVVKEVISGKIVIFKSLIAGNVANDPATHSSTTGAAALYVSGTTYAAGAVIAYLGPAYVAGTTYAAGTVVRSANRSWVSLAGSNTGKTPSSSPTWWALTVEGYISLVGSNTGNQPDSSPSDWAPLVWLPWSNQLPMEMDFNCVLSVSQAQRLAKIALLRNRAQGSGSLPLNLNAWTNMPLDVAEITFSHMGWYGQLLELVSSRFYTEMQDGSLALRFEGNFQITDPSIYEWSPAEELTVYDVSANPGNTIIAPLSQSYTLSPVVVLSQPTSTTIAVAGFAANFGLSIGVYASRTETISAPSVPTWLYVTIEDPTQRGESGTAVLAVDVSTSNSLVGVQGNTYLGAILALPAGSATRMTAGGWPSPSTTQVGI